MIENNPLAEVFGYPVDDFSDDAQHSRENELCPFHNEKNKCTKVESDNPLGACSVQQEGKPIITCPTRFTEEWKILDDASSFFFDSGTECRVFREFNVTDANGKGAGKVDFVLAKVNGQDIVDFGGIEVQAVYTSGGGMRASFEHYMEDPTGRVDFDWRSYSDKFPRPDWPSAYKRLFHQLQKKGGIFHQLGKKQAIPIQTDFFEYHKMPDLTTVPEAQADLVWLLYNLEKTDEERWSLQLKETLYTEYETAVAEVASTRPADTEDKYLSDLQEKLNGNPNALNLTVS